MAELLGIIFAALFDSFVVYIVFRGLCSVLFKKSDNKMVYTLILSFLTLFMLNAKYGNYGGMFRSFLILSLIVIIDTKRRKRNVSSEKTREQKMADSY